MPLIVVAASLTAKDSLINDGKKRTAANIYII